MSTQRIPFRRRQFFIKRGFQSRFALYPLVFFSLFLLGAGIYLHWYLQGFLEFEMYLPHSRLQNPWEEIAPVLLEVVLWGGGAFLVALGLWAWRRFGTLHRDLDQLADWLAAHARGQGEATAPVITDHEVRALGQGLGAAVALFEDWDERVRAGIAAARDAADVLPDAKSGDRAALARAVGGVRVAFDALGATVAEVAVDEGLS
ncbi:MAG: hypothetical protein P1P84_02325 [Deferrisomatales bacterium]|nr:hypothetical protein [Deferrisomatales bacterium]